MEKPRDLKMYPSMGSFGGIKMMMQVEGKERGEVGMKTVEVGSRSSVFTRIVFCPKETVDDFRVSSLVFPWIPNYFPLITIFNDFQTEPHQIFTSLGKKNRSSPSPSAPEVMESKGFSLMNDDLLQKILSRLPANSFASASGVSKAWNAACTRILSRPKLSSAISLNPSPHVAIQEVFDKVMSQPIRPHFAIASVGPGFDLKYVLQFMVEKLGTRTPIILSSVSGIIGRDALTHEFREVKWTYGNIDDEVSTNTGMVLTVGYVPGLKVDAIPLLGQKKAPLGSNIDNFVMDIKSYTYSVAGCTPPLAIIMIGDEDVDQKPIIEKLDFAMPMETIIVGDERGQFVYRSGNESRNISNKLKLSPDAVALVFAKDRYKAHGVGDIEFHFALSNGVSAVGPRLKAASVRVKDSESVTCLTARGGQQEILDGQHLLDYINNEMENHMECDDLFIGVTRQRNCSVGSDKPRLMTSLALHGVVGGDEQYLYVDGVGIRKGDSFQFYRSDPKAALPSCRDVSSTLRNLKLGWDSKGSLGTRAVVNPVDKREVFGGFIFSCCGRGESFFGHLNVDSSPFLDNFPGVPLAGIFCCGEIGRGYTSLTSHGGEEEGSAHCLLHVYSTVYLVMSYNPSIRSYPMGMFGL
ncbi:F-box/LRR-repeat protein At5g63520-like [Durio zibethinus]|uniref:F-box/LRR-repeat protein At5g63520-like n=1 Tax=Durio zibethinus TaxID=66656 RepID=A0A6P5WKV8_DURZI|nr:F-box/LRR-repeat protein At5g63520-like [Durio zibethinus]